jgi:hypothetical protein
MPETASPTDHTEPAALDRQCGSCTACCDGWLKFEVSGHKIDHGQPCPFCKEHSCTIYERRPKDPCRDFICGWLAPTSPLPDWMRPDKADMILLPAKFRWQEHPVDVAVAVGERPKAEALDWLKSFCAARKRLLVYQDSEDWYAFGPPAFRYDIRHRIARGERPWT